MPFLPGALRGRKLKGNIPVVFIDPVESYRYIYLPAGGNGGVGGRFCFFSVGLKIIQSDYLFDKDPVFVRQIQIVAAYMHHRVS